MKKKKLINLGPGLFITAAFIGPGTVITASLAGANYGYSLIWALVFSVIATAILQEMAGRLGIVTGKGLGENIRESIKQPAIRWFASTLVVAAIVVGNAAYQGGNISGASLGLSNLFGNAEFKALWPGIIGLSAFSLLWTGQYKVLEKALFILVGVMSIAFILTFALSQPDIVKMMLGLIAFQLPDGASLTVIALIGTTVVPYNLFLYSSSIQQKWKDVKDISDANKNLYLSVSIGGLITLAILSTAATAFFGKQISINSAADLAPALKPLFGHHAEILMALGLFSAGITSAITAPLAAAFALCGILNLNPAGDFSNTKFRLIWITVLLFGVIAASLGYKPISVIWLAQVANGILLPLITLFLIWMVNSKQMLEYKNNKRQNILALIVFIVTLLLGGKSLIFAFSS